MAKPAQTPPADERRVVEALVEKHGEGVAHIASDGPLDSDVRDYVSTQCASLDYAIGRPGVPIGRLTNVVGREGSGKSTLGLHILAETQRRGGIAIYIDSEGRYTRERGERIGLDHDRLIYMPGDTLEQVYRGMKSVMNEAREAGTDKLITVVFDSLAMTPTEAELKGDYKPADVARLTSKELKEIHKLVTRQKVCLVIINQLRAKIDFGPSSYSAGAETQLAENSLRYYSSLRIRMHQRQKWPKPGEETGILVEAECYKNTLAPPFKRAFMVIDFLSGIDRVHAQLEVAKAIGAVTAKGTWLVAEGYEKSFHPADFPAVLEAVPAIGEAVAQAPTLWLNGGAS